MRRNSRAVTTGKRADQKVFNFTMPTWLSILAHIAAGIGVLVGWFLIAACYAQFRQPRGPRRRR